MGGQHTNAVDCQIYQHGKEVVCHEGLGVQIGIVYQGLGNHHHGDEGYHHVEEALYRRGNALPMEYDEGESEQEGGRQKHRHFGQQILSQPNQDLGLRGGAHRHQRDLQPTAQRVADERAQQRGPGELLEPVFACRFGICCRMSRHYTM